MIIAFISYPVLDLDRAVEFYQKVLGIEPLFHREDWAEFNLEGQRFALQKVKTPKLEHSGPTLYFMAQSLEESINRLEKIGAKLLGTPESYTYGKLVRFKDPEGNVLGLYEPPMK